MIDLHEALSEISAIRGCMARGSEFRGYGPTTLAATGLLAFTVGALQRDWVPDPSHRAVGYLGLWIATAAVSLALIGTEAVTRARRIHSSLAMEMLYNALEQFIPALVAGALLTGVMLRFAPDNLWMLPGLWQVLFSLGVFSSCRFLPKPTFGVGVWYLASGLACLAFGRGNGALSPWEMGVPFGVGQLLVAAALQFGYRNVREEA